jgi:hypothetical protein
VPGQTVPCVFGTQTGHGCHVVRVWARRSRFGTADDLPTTTTISRRSMDLRAALARSPVASTTKIVGTPSPQRTHSRRMSGFACVAQLPIVGHVIPGPGNARDPGIPGTYDPRTPGSRVHLVTGILTTPGDPGSGFTANPGKCGSLAHPQPDTPILAASGSLSKARLGRPSRRGRLGMPGRLQ